MASLVGFFFGFALAVLRVVEVFFVAFFLATLFLAPFFLTTRFLAVFFLTDVFLAAFFLAAFFLAIVPSQQCLRACLERDAVTKAYHSLML